MDETKTAIVLARLTDRRLREVYLDPTRRGWTPLMQAVGDGDHAAVAEAIAGSADVDAIAEGSDSALALACAAGSEPMVAALLAAGADATVRTRHDRSMLHLAARHASGALVRRLLDAGAQVVADTFGDSPLAVAVEHDRLEILDMVIEQPLPNGEPERAFGVACDLGRLAAMRRLWERFGATVLTGSPNPLMRASSPQGPNRVTPAGRPSLRNPAGTASAARSSRFAKVV